MYQIKTDRLRLISLDAEMLEHLKKGRNILENNLGLEPSNMQISSEMLEEINEALEFWQQFTKEQPENYQWGTNWEIILAEENRSIGGIGLGGPPNKNGQVTVGYHIDPRKQHKGYAPEALAGIRDWAMKHPHCTSMVAFTPIENLPSQKVLTKCGFDLVDQVVEAGIECYFWRYKVRA